MKTRKIRKEMAAFLPALLMPLLLAWVPQSWAGDCKGHRQVLRGPPGHVTDGMGNYSVNGNCEWLIKAPSSSYSIVLNFTFMETECTYDYLFVYDGDSYDSPLLASLTGTTLPQPIEAKSGKMLLHLFSDANYNLLGFNATYSFSVCPGACGGHGRCDHALARCLCHPGWGGPGCATPLCSQACVLHGVCDTTGERCLCTSGFVGQSCQLGLRDDSGAGQWWEVSGGDDQMAPRTAAAGVYVPSTGAMYIFGGFDLNKALGDLVKYNFTNNKWERRSCILSSGSSLSHSCGMAGEHGHLWGRAHQRFPGQRRLDLSLNLSDNTSALLQKNDRATVTSLETMTPFGQVANVLVADLGYSTCSQLYDSCVCPTFNYAAGVWGYKKAERAIAVSWGTHIHIGVHIFSPSVAIQEDVGWEPLEIRQNGKVVPLWNRLINIPESTITKKVFNLDLAHNHSGTKALYSVFMEADLVYIFRNRLCCNANMVK